jgi:hypothetical protein
MTWTRHAVPTGYAYMYGVHTESYNIWKGIICSADGTRTSCVVAMGMAGGLTGDVVADMGGGSKRRIPDPDSNPARAPPPPPPRARPHHVTTNRQLPNKATPRVASTMGPSHH